MTMLLNRDRLHHYFESCYGASSNNRDIFDAAVADDVSKNLERYYLPAVILPVIHVRDLHQAIRNVTRVQKAGLRGCFLINQHEILKTLQRPVLKATSLKRKKELLEAKKKKAREAEEKGVGDMDEEAIFEQSDTEVESVAVSDAGEMVVDMITSYDYREMLPIVIAVRKMFPNMFIGVNFLGVTGDVAFPVLARLAKADFSDLLPVDRELLRLQEDEQNIEVEAAVNDEIKNMSAPNYDNEDKTAGLGSAAHALAMPVSAPAAAAPPSLKLMAEIKEEDARAAAASSENSTPRARRPPPQRPPRAEEGAAFPPPTSTAFGSTSPAAEEGPADESTTAGDAPARVQAQPEAEATISRVVLATWNDLEDVIAAEDIFDASTTEAEGTGGPPRRPPAPGALSAEAPQESFLFAPEDVGEEPQDESNVVQEQPPVPVSSSSSKATVEVDAGQQLQVQQVQVEHIQAPSAIVRPPPQPQVLHASVPHLKATVEYIGHLEGYASPTTPGVSVAHLEASGHGSAATPEADRFGQLEAYATPGPTPGVSVTQLETSAHDTAPPTVEEDAAMPMLSTPLLPEGEGSAATSEAILEEVEQHVARRNVPAPPGGEGSAASEANVEVDDAAPEDPLRTMPLPEPMAMQRVPLPEGEGSAAASETKVELEDEAPDVLLSQGEADALLSRGGVEDPTFTSAGRIISQDQARDQEIRPESLVEQQDEEAASPALAEDEQVQAMPALRMTGATEAERAAGVFVDAYWADTALIDERTEEQPAANLVRSVQDSVVRDWNGLYFGGVCFKKQRPVPPDLYRTAAVKACHFSAQAQAKIASDTTGAVTRHGLHDGLHALTRHKHGYMDVVMTSGEATGVEADEAKIAAMRAGVGPQKPLGLASGVTPENVGKYLSLGVDVLLVATGVSEDFHELSDEKLTALVDAMIAWDREQETQKELRSVALEKEFGGNQHMLELEDQSTEFRAGRSTQTSRMLARTRSLSPAQHAFLDTEKKHRQAVEERKFPFAKVPMCLKRRKRHLLLQSENVQDDFRQPPERFQYAWLDPSSICLDMNRCVLEMLVPFCFGNRGTSTCEYGGPRRIDLVAGPDAAGFYYAGALASYLDCGFLSLRKEGKLGCETVGVEFVNYTGKSQSIHVRNNFELGGLNVLLVDQWVETGGTMDGCVRLITEELGCNLVGIATVGCEGNDAVRGALKKWTNIPVHQVTPACLRGFLDNRDLLGMKRALKI